MLAVAAGVLYRVEGSTALSMGTVLCRPGSIYYAELNNLIYIGHTVMGGRL